MRRRKHKRKRNYADSALASTALIQPWVPPVRYACLRQLAPKFVVSPLTDLVFVLAVLVLAILEVDTKQHAESGKGRSRYSLILSGKAIPNAQNLTRKLLQSSTFRAGSGHLRISA